MGRNLCEEEDGWCYRETDSEHFARITVYFTSKEAALAPLEGEYPPHLMNDLREYECVPPVHLSIDEDGNETSYFSGLNLDRIMYERGFSFGGRDYLHDTWE